MPLIEDRTAIDNRIERLQIMMLSRECDTRESILVRQGHGPFHVGAAGHEAVSGLAYSLRPGDYIFPYYRDRALVLALGYPLEMIASEFFGSNRSASAGANLPGHYSSRSMNIFPVATPTGAQCLPAVGAAWAIQRRGSDGVVLCSLGDAATRQGEFFEAVCFAVQYQLPLVFVIHDNGIGISTRTAGLLPFDLGVFDTSLLRDIDASNLDEVIETGRWAVNRARSQSGPSILRCRVDRLCGHTSSDDQSVYRSLSELTELSRRDPISLYADSLIADSALTEVQYKAAEAEFHDRLDRIYGIASSEVPATAYQSMSAHFSPISPILAQEARKPAATMVAALNNVLADRLISEPESLIFGQDIEDPKGGVFGFTKGLSNRFPGRVINAPLAEATMIGAGVGLAALGMKPIVEVQFVDFIAPGFQQLTSQAATLRWRSAGDWRCPLVIYAPYGAYLPSGGPWHSQSNEALFAHVPGLRVAVPSTPADVTDLFEDAFQCEDPSLILIPKHVFRIRHTETIGDEERLGFGKARVVRTGGDVTLAAWGNCVSLGMDAAKIADEAGIAVEIVDLRSLAPCDWETLAKSLGKTGRLVVVQEDTRTCGFGQTVISELLANPVLFSLMKAPPILVSRPDAHVPFNAATELAILPNVADILRALDSEMDTQA